MSWLNRQQLKDLDSYKSGSTDALSDLQILMYNNIFIMLFCYRAGSRMIEQKPLTKQSY